MSTPDGCRSPRPKAHRDGRPAGPCVHCGAWRPYLRPRGLGQCCYYLPGVRELYGVERPDGRGRRGVGLRTPPPART